MLNGKYCIYKYIYNDEVVYVGKSNCLDDRIRQHNEEIRFFGLNEIYYFICDNKNMMDVNEAYYINLYKPILNRQNVLINKKYENLINANPEWYQYIKSYAYPLPYIKEFNEQLLDKQFDEDGILGTYFLSEPIKFFEYGGLKLVTLNDIREYQLQLRNSLDDIIGNKVAEISNHLCANKKIKKITYKSHNHFSIEEY